MPASCADVVRPPRNHLAVLACSSHVPHALSLRMAVVSRAKSSHKLQWRMPITFAAC